ncbi:hypothetical protein F4823DRAFT_558235 [Ustulina deusta]|nr:hypothetical protein F4823DRAFT_558235 [Ustulina deusta]
MSISSLMQARPTGISIYNLASRSASSAITLSTGAIAAITVGGSVLIILVAVGPFLVYLSKRQDRRRAASCPASSLSFAEHGQFVEDGDAIGPRRLRKKSVVSERVAYPGIKDVESEGGRGGGESTKNFSLPHLPPVVSRPGTWRISGPLSGNAPWNNGAGGDTNGDAGGSGSRAGADDSVHGEPMHRSPEKHRGYIINQNRRKTSWIDEDALHGPRVSPTKNTRRKSSWFSGNELTRTLSRHLSFRRFGAPELARSPTLPCIETSQEQGFGGGMPEESLASRKTRSTGNAHPLHEFAADIEPRFPVHQPIQQRGSLNSQPRAQREGAALPSPQGHSNVVIDAAQQLAGRARVPSLDAGANGQRYSCFQQGSTDAELQAILRRTAERLQDGSQSARRQTLMLPTASSSSRLPDQTRRDPDQEYGWGRDGARPGDMTPSPAKSQRSAPAAMLYSELEGCSSRIKQGPSQNGSPWQTHRRTHTRPISQVSPLSMRSEPDSMVATPSRCSSQTEVSHTLLPSPSRMAQTLFSYPQQVLDPRSYSPASEKSSALSTVYSEDESSPPMIPLEAKSVPDGGNEMEKRAMAQALRACDAFDGGQTPKGCDAGNDGESNHNPQPLHMRKETLEQILPNPTQTVAVSAPAPKDGITQPEAGNSPQAMSAFTPQTVKATREDPFTTCQTPTRNTPQRLSQVFSPLPAEVPGDSMSPSVNEMRAPSETPTPSPSHRRVIPPPYHLRPLTSSPTLGHSQDPQFHIQPPSREPSPVASESGLSSVYDSYRYSRYSDSVEGSQVLARLSAATTLTVPPAEASPTESRWDEDIIPVTSIKSRKNYCGMESGVGAPRSAHVNWNNAVLRAGAYTHSVGTLKPSVVEDGCVKMGYTVEDTLPRSQQPRQISLGDVSNSSGESAYSQDEDGQDRLGPLMPFYPMTAASGKHAMRVTSAVAELRRMNSQVSCVSGYSTATTNIAGDVSPTLPALRGGGCSPGKKGVDGGSKNYLALGNRPACGGGEGEDSNAASKRDNAGSGRIGNGQNEEVIAPVGIRDTVTLRKGRLGRSRGSTVVERFEQDLDRARQALRDSQGYNLQAISEASTSVNPHEPRTHAVKLSQEEGRKCLMGLGLYDDKGFLRNSLTSQDLTEHA